MKPGPVTKLCKRNKVTSKNCDDVMSEICDVIVIFSIYDKFGAIWKPDSGGRVRKTYVFIKSNLYLTKTENGTKYFLTQLSQYCFE